MNEGVPPVYQMSLFRTPDGGWGVVYSSLNTNGYYAYYGRDFDETVRAAQDALKELYAKGIHRPDETIS